MSIDNRSKPKPGAGFSFCLAILLAALVGFVSPAIMARPAFADTAGGLLTITFDDGSRSQYDHGLRLARERGLPGTIFIPTGLISDQGASAPDQWLMTWPDVREFAAAGWEIGAHGHSHISLPDLMPEAVERELVAPIQEIEFQTGTRPVSFSSPFGRFTDETIEQVMLLYKYHLSWKGHSGRNPKFELDQRYIGRLEITHDIFPATVCGEMVRAAQDGKWLVLLFHGFVEENPGEYEVTAKSFDEVLACAETLADTGLIEVVTVRDAMDAISGN